MEKFLSGNISFCNGVISGVAPGISQWGADSSYEGAKIWFLGYYKCQNLQKIAFYLLMGG